ncbi:MAG: FtsX-like permease family protein [Acutalibacteraceae bacterium]|nr:FtsX-like permease family protein [Acutalibacteraceae bacterium]
MNKVLNKRILRDLKANLTRYIALLVMIIAGMFIVISVVGAADTIITGTTELALKNKIEDGQFSVFIPLTNEQEKEITDSGVSLEKMFSTDIDVNGSTLRLMKIRENINLIHLDSGELPSKRGEAVIEKRYAEEHNISIGDSIEIYGTNLKITGIGSVPEYDMPLNKLSDTGVESSLFGLLFVTFEQYDSIIKSNAVLEEYCYAYCLNNSMTDNELKEKIKDFDFDYNRVEDKYFREMYDEIFSSKEDLQEGISDLCGGAKDLSDGLSKLTEENSTLSDGSEKIFSAFLAQTNVTLASQGITEQLTVDNYSEVLGKYYSLTGKAEFNDIKIALDDVKKYSNGLGEYTDGVEETYDGSIELYDGTVTLKKETDKLLDEVYQVDIDNLCTFIKAEDNPRILASATDVQTNKTVGLMAGVIVMLLFTYVISVFVVHQIQSESSVIGALYALGAKKKDIISHYITLPAIVCTIGGMIGSALAFSNIGIPWQMTDNYNYFSIPELAPKHPIYLLVYAVLMPPIVSIIVNYILISRKLSKTALSLMRNEQNAGRHSKIKLGDMSFIKRFQVRQMTREIRTGLTVILGMFICMLIFMLGMNCYVLCDNISKENAEDTKYEYMYNLKYPEEVAPENAEACYVESLSKTSLGHTLDVNIIGVDNDNRYYPVKPEKGRSSIVAGSSTAQKYGLSVGDKLILSDTANDIDYAFTVEEIADYSVGLTVFMDIDSMRELFGQGEDYYNMLLSDEKLDIEVGRIYSVTTKADIEKSSSVFINLMKGMFTMLVTMSIAIFCVVMYLMLNVMIDRASFGISLIKIFGYKTKEIRKLYLNGNTLTIALGAVISIPSAKLIMDAIYPYFIAQNACGLNLHFPWYLYVMIFVAVMIFYFVVSSLLVRKIKKITPAEVLKNRE